jgi:hypothetical protein
MWYLKKYKKSFKIFCHQVGTWILYYLSIYIYIYIYVVYDYNIRYEHVILSLESMTDRNFIDIMWQWMWKYDEDDYMCY